MVSPLDRKLLRDLWRMKLQSFAIALVIAVGIPNEQTEERVIAGTLAHTGSIPARVVAHPVAIDVK